MRHSRGARAVVAIAALFPSVASANAGVGFFSPASFLLLGGGPTKTFWLVARRTQRKEGIDASRAGIA